MALQSPDVFSREYFDWSEEEFAQKFVEKISAGRLRQNEAYIDLKLEKKSPTQKVKAAYKDAVNLPSLVKLLPGLASNPTLQHRFFREEGLRSLCDDFVIFRLYNVTVSGR